MARLLLGCLVIFTLLCSSSAEPDILSRFLNFVDDFKRTYKNDTHEFQRRLEYFKINLQKIEKLNQAYGGTGSAVYGVTKFSDLSQAEFKALYLNGLRPKPVRHDTTLKFRGESLLNQRQTTSAPLPKKIDWRKAGVVSAVKNQGSCGACWAFAAAETVESAFAIKHNTSAPNFAVQQLIDCSKKNYGCEGGDICVALNYVQTNGITYDRNYPLTDSDGTCKSLPSTDKLVRVTNFNCNQFVGKEDHTLSLLATVGPVTAAVDATTWNNYVGGIIQYHCETSLNHAVEIIGYDLTGPVPYYIVRNSWGTDFGMDGYLYIKVGSNLCGIAQEVADVYTE